VSPQSPQRTALVTGGNRGIGLETSRQLLAKGLHVVVGARHEAFGQEAAHELSRDPHKRGDVHHVVLDIASDASVKDAARALAAAGIDIDVLVNNAGIYPEGDTLSASDDVWREAIETNFIGALRTCRAFVPAMVRRAYGRVVNVSSGYGSFGEGLEGPAPYSVTKAALDALTRKLAEDVRGDVKVNAVCPGWVKTRMGGRSAPRPVEKGAETLVWLATLDESGPNGGFFRDKKPIPW
jgi:NAD(P)-dependent dehydrogenase (short-subunit alcohol dehydrogenase family)